MKNPNLSPQPTREFLLSRTQHLYRRAMVDVEAAIAGDLFNETFRLENPLPPVLPFGGVYHGLEGLRRYLAELAAHLRIEAFRLASIHLDGDTAVVTGLERSRFRQGGGSYEMEWVHLLRFDSRGRYAALREYNDTAALLAAWHEGAAKGGARP